jgi:hypothetical protein
MPRPAKADFRREIAHRLVDFARTNKPGQSENWYWEKAIANSILDRR